MDDGRVAIEHIQRQPASVAPTFWKESARLVLLVPSTFSVGSASHIRSASRAALLVPHPRRNHRTLRPCRRRRCRHRLLLALPSSSNAKVLLHIPSTRRICFPPPSSPPPWSVKDVVPTGGTLIWRSAPAMSRGISTSLVYLGRMHHLMPSPYQRRQEVGYLKF